jgi:hypothetical protein
MRMNGRFWLSAFRLPPSALCLPPSFVDYPAISALMLRNAAIGSGARVIGRPITR